MQTDTLIYTSPLTTNNHILKIYIDSVTNFYYINLTAYSQDTSTSSASTPLSNKPKQRSTNSPK